MDGPRRSAGRAARYGPGVGVLVLGEGGGDAPGAGPGRSSSGVFVTRVLENPLTVSLNSLLPAVLM